MAKREPVKSKPVVQNSLFHNTAKKSVNNEKPNMTIDRAKYDAIAESRIAQNLPLYILSANSMKCLLCNNTTTHELYVKNKFCIDCSTLHDIDYK